MDSCCDVISFALRAETSCQTNADKNFILSCFVFRCGRNRADKYERQYFHHVGCREHLERGTVKQVISKWLELTSFVFTKTHARKEHNFTPATSDWRWGKCHWELHTAASFHLFTDLFFYIFVSQTSKKKKKKRFDTRACARHVEPFSAWQTSPKIPAVTTRLQRAAHCNFPQHRLPFWKALNDRLFNTVYLALCVEPPVKASLLSFCQNRHTRLSLCQSYTNFLSDLRWLEGGVATNLGDQSVRVLALFVTSQRAKIQNFAFYAPFSF